MNTYSLMFYATAGLIGFATVLAVTRRRAVHSVVFLVISFLGTAMLFYLMGSPFLAALQVIVYAGAIMVLFLFIIMMLEIEAGERGNGQFWGPGLLAGGLFFSCACVAVFTDPAGPTPLNLAMISPKEFGGFIFEHYWLSVEIVSLLLLLALVAAIHLGRNQAREGEDQE